MNVYLFELRRAWKGALVWAAVLLAFLIAMVVGIYPMFLDSRASMEAVIDGFPKEFKAAFGVFMDDIFSFGGFYSFCFLYAAVMGAAMASSLGLGLFSREKRAKCMDFLMTKPASRGRLFFAKLLAALTLLAAANAAYTAVFTAMSLPRSGGAPAGWAVLAGSALLFTQLIILAASVFFGVFLKKVRSVAAGAVAITMAGFVLTALGNLLEDRASRFLAVYGYFDVNLALKEGRFDAPLALTAAAASAVLLAAAYVGYCRGEIRSV